MIEDGPKELVISAVDLRESLLQRKSVLVDALGHAEAEAQSLRGQIGEVNYWIKVVENTRPEDPVPNPAPNKEH